MRGFGGKDHGFSFVLSFGCMHIIHCGSLDLSKAQRLCWGRRGGFGSLTFQEVTAISGVGMIIQGGCECCKNGRGPGREDGSQRNIII